MLPKNSLSRIKDVASKIGVEETIAKEVISFFYDDLRKSLSDLVHYNVHVEALGTFFIKRKELAKTEKKHREHLVFLESDRFKRMAIKVRIQGEIAKIEKLNALLEKERLRRKKFREENSNVNTE